MEVSKKVGIIKLKRKMMKILTRCFTSRNKISSPSKEKLTELL